jgi:hypothetical protein
MNRRSFFQSLAGIAAAITVGPALALQSRMPSLTEEPVSDKPLPEDAAPYDVGVIMCGKPTVVALYANRYVMIRDQGKTATFDGGGVRQVTHKLAGPGITSYYMGEYQFLTNTSLTFAARVIIVDGIVVKNKTGTRILASDVPAFARMFIYPHPRIKEAV